MCAKGLKVISVHKKINTHFIMHLVQAVARFKSKLAVVSMQNQIASITIHQHCLRKTKFNQSTTPSASSSRLGNFTSFTWYHFLQLLRNTFISPKISELIKLKKHFVANFLSLKHYSYASACLPTPCLQLITSAIISP